MGQNYILERIRITRERSNVSQKQMADHLGITQSTYSKKEAIPKRLSLEEIFKIAEYLKVPVSYLTESEVEWTKIEALIEEKEDFNKRKIWDQSSEIGQLKSKISRIEVKYQQDMQERRADYMALFQEKSNMFTKHSNAKDEWYNIRLNLNDELRKVKGDLNDAKYKLRSLSSLAKELEETMINDILEFLTLPKIESHFEKAGFDDLGLDSEGRKNLKSVLKVFQNAYKEVSNEFQVRLEKLKIVRD
jgi:transcriptional regulator with XRE-family HTH domain